MSKLPARPKPSRALDVQAQVIEDYDDGDPYSCMAAGFAEDKAKASAADALAIFRMRVECCRDEHPNEMKKLLEEDAESLKAVLYDIWYDCRFIHAKKGDVADWAAKESAKIGNKTLLEYDQSR